MKALGRGFSAAPFNTFTIRFGSKGESNLLVPKGESNLSEEIDSQVFFLYIKWKFDWILMGCFIQIIVNQGSKILIEPSNDPKILTSNWQFSIMELAGSHYAAICTEKDKLAKGICVYIYIYSSSSSSCVSKIEIIKSLIFFLLSCVEICRRIGSSS